ncbi:hypothetical protein DFH29DRAFT_884084 [Suillus ampliporus]|nr:hypothetical protein DFH29DRAFT_884084 [Suillus ampliporus]
MWLMAPVTHLLLQKAAGGVTAPRVIAGAMWDWDWALVRLMMRLAVAVAYVGVFFCVLHLFLLGEGDGEQRSAGGVRAGTGRDLCVEDPGEGGLYEKGELGKGLEWKKVNCSGSIDLNISLVINTGEMSGIFSAGWRFDR